MLELLLCSLVTILPDYLFRRYLQGKRFGKEITFYSVWYELRWGITGCLMLTVPILPEAAGRVADVNVDFSAPVKKGDVLFRLDSSKQEAALETAKRRVAEVDASLISARADLVKAEAQIGEAKASYQLAKDELDTKSELQRRNPGIVPQRDIEKLRVALDQRQAGIDAVSAAKESAALRVSTLLPAEKASAEAAMAEAQVDLDKTYIRAGVDGRVEQFLLRKGDVVNQMMRPAGVLIPEGAGRRVLQAGFGQIEAQVMKPGMIAEATCISKPWAIIPLVVTGVQDYIAAGQFRSGEQLIDPQSLRQPGTILAFLEPLYSGGLEGVTPGSSCIVNAYTSNHDLIADPKTGALRGFALHVVDATGLVHALLLRVQALLLPVKTLVLSGH
ncbi:MAG: HlyD family secretion protein [Rhizobiales bacterium]|nr:HlyD family secretion protein [Hyphomicrobiales bacterium]